MRIWGGLGNQMFQYAAGHALAHRLGVDLWLHPVETRPEHARFALEIFERSLKIWEPSNGSSGLFKPFTRPKKGKKAVSAWRGPVFEQSQFCSTEGFEDIKPGSYVIGYFQSERFFVEQAQSIRDFFDIARITDNALRDHLDAANKPDSVAIHIRRGDYATDPKTRATHGLLQDEYYQRAMKLMERLQNVRAWLIFSDDPNAAAELTSNWPQRTIITGNSAIQDMALMSTCSHHIIANSSFSWWGAWLCSNPDKTIIAPRRWLSETEMQRRYVDGVYPEGWLLI
jgi:hypothetical protein